MSKKIQVGDLVTRRSYGGDLVFRVIQIDEKTGTAVLRCQDTRLMADASIDDLEDVHTNREERGGYTQVADAMEKSPLKQSQKMAQADAMARHLRQEDPINRDNYGQVFGTVLHLDGDQRYLEECMAKYNELKITANGYYIDEAEQPARIQELYLKHRPDMVVITGHDGMKRAGSNNLTDFYSSAYFVDCVKKLRVLVTDKDSLVIFAGACQSFYEALIGAGANFASAPKRVNIHTFDPVKVVEKIVMTTVKEIVAVRAVIDNSITGIEGIGGIESRGKMRLILPKI